MAVPCVAALALAWALHALPMQVTGAPAAHDDAAALAVRVADARIRWFDALDAARWDRDAAGPRAAGDAITEDLLPSVGRTDEAGHDALVLLAEIGADALGPWLHTEPSPPEALLYGYLAHHDDPALLGVVSPGSSGSVIELSERLARDEHRASAAANLASAYGVVGAGYPRAIVCGAALGLPGASRLLVARAAVASWGAAPTDDLAPQCVALGAMLPEGRARIAGWLRATQSNDVSTTGPLPGWLGVALLALAGSERAETARVGLERMLGPRASIADRLYYWMQVVEPIGHFAAWLPLRAPAARAVLARLAPLTYPEQPWIAIVRLRAGDPGVVAEALETLRNPNLPEGPLEIALGVAGVAAGASPAESTEVHERIASLRNLLRSQGRSTPSREEIDAWIAAIDRVGACAGRRACLVDLLDRGSDDAAARAVHALGPTGLASLSPAEARPLLRRLLVAPSPWLLAAFAIAVEGCPSSLRGAREVPVPEDSTGTGPLMHAFRRACAEHAP